MRLYAHELRTQLRLYARSRELAFFTFLLPILFLVLLGSVYGGDRFDGVRGQDYLLVGMVGYGIAATAFAGLAIVLVLRRENGVLKRVRATPLPAWAYIAAMLSTTALAFVLETICLFAIGIAAFDAQVPERLLSLVLALLLGTAAFASLGIAIAALVKRGEGASAVVNAIYLPMTFLSGSFFPRDSFPSVLEAIADVLPLTHFIRLVGAVVLLDDEIWDRPLEVAVVAAWGLAGLAVAVRAFRWEPTQG